MEPRPEQWLRGPELPLCVQEARGLSLALLEVTPRQDLGETLSYAQT